MDKLTAQEAFIGAQSFLNRTAELIQAGREMRPANRTVIKDDLYNLMDQYWKYQAVALNAQARSKL